MNKNTQSFTIGRLAKRVGVNIETIRYYQKQRLIQEPLKPKNGYRIYPLETIDRIQFIKRAQQLGFTLAEIKQLLELGDGQCKDVQQLADQKRHSIETRINDLEAMKKVLDELLIKCRHNENQPKCAMIEALGKKA